jgi:hypothetical protein
MSRKILNIGTFGLAGLLLGKKKKAELAPAAPEAPAIMPVADDEAVLRARKRSIVSQIGRRGRDSTMLTPPGSTLGG